MSFNNKNEKSDEAFNVGRRVPSSGSRRVMWKLSDEEETFDTIVVDYRCVPKKKPTPKTEAETATGTNEAEEAASTLEASGGSENRPDAWAYIYSLIKSKQFGEELTQPNLALRYKPSKESLKYKRSKEQQLHQQQQQQQLQAQQQQQQEAEPLLKRQVYNSKADLTDLKVESCCLPPQQRAVVQDMPPKFAQSIPHDHPNDSDSSDNIAALANMAAKVIASNNANRAHANSCNKLRAPGGRLSASVPSPNSSLDAVPILQQETQRLSHSTGGLLSKRKTEAVTKSAKSSGSAQKLVSSSTAINPFRQRQIELHRYRIKVEQRRLELLDLKIAREREDAIRQQILFQKDLEFKTSQMKQLNDDDL